MTGALSDDEYLASFARDTEALAVAAEQRLDAPVAGCPGWSVADLSYHVGSVHRFWTHILTNRLQTPEEPGIERPPDPELPAWLRAGVEPLIAVASATDPATPIWTWSHRRDAGFVPRRMAHETAVHRWDGEAAVGAPNPITPRLAVDGIDEVFDLMLPFVAPGYDGPAIDAHLHCTDTEGEWVLHVADGGFAVEHAHAKQPVALRGTASDLLLLLWRRVPVDAVEVLGDEAMAEALVGLTDLE